MIYLSIWYKMESEVFELFTEEDHTQQIINHDRREAYV